MKYPEATRTAVVADYREGIHVKAIARNHGVSVETVRTWARMAGINRCGGDYHGRCRSCAAPRARRSGFCRPCEAEIPLTGGRWIGRGGIVVWERAS